jgi:hypothetical protein
MTDREKVRILAEGVMGWSVFDHSEWMRFWPKEPGAKCRMYDPEGGTGNWNPLESIADAWMVVEKLSTTEPNGFCIYRAATNEVPERRWLAEFAGCEVWSDTAPRAICEAALKASEGSVK